MTDNRVSRTLVARLQHLSFFSPGLCGGSAQPPDLLDERNPGEEEVAPLVSRHHSHEQDEAAQLRLQMTLSRAGQVGQYYNISTSSTTSLHLSGRRQETQTPVRTHQERSFSIGLLRVSSTKIQTLIGLKKTSHDQ